MRHKKLILIVEDNELNRGILCEILSDEYRVLEAENGQEALDILRQNKDKVALILLDVMMPVMDGYTFLDIVKKDDELALIPIIVTTQSSSEEDEVSAMSHGATDFVPKPYRPKVILHRVASLIRLRETAAMVNQFQYDRLTGLYSKEFFFEKVRRQLMENPDKEYSIVCSDIENFKLYNDIFGREAGDCLLRDIADVLKKMVGNSGFCARFDGDRFLCLQESEQERIDRSSFGQHEQKITPAMKNIVMRWGIYEIVDRSVSVEKMCDRAMLAVNSIKGNYNSFFAVYDDTLRSRLLREKAITDSVVKAMDEGQFMFYLQPKYSLRDNCMTGAEALVRWIHPEWGFMSPGEFIPLFEKNGFIPSLDQYIWGRVCALIRSWLDRGFQPLPISVNVSRADVYQLNLVDIIPGLTEKYGIDPSLLHLEITESAYSEDFGQIISTVDRLRSLGFIVEMDDFGSGYSSLNMLSRMTIDVLKLDMKFIQNEISKPSRQSILNDVVSMAHRMNLSVVAEGVENREQMIRLQEVGCDCVQGFYFARPMPVTEFEELLKAQSSSCLNSYPKLSVRKDNMRNILIADEDAGYREKVQQTFEGKYNVTALSDAGEALDYLRTCGNRVSVMILSLTLPDRGAELLLKEMRQKPEFWDILVLGTIPNGDATANLPMAMETDDFLCKRHPLIDLERRIRHMMEIVDCRERENILLDEACRDFMTDLLNRRGLKEAMDSLRKEEKPLALLLFDLDNLKKVNDTCGHDAGDQMIRSFADLIRRKTRTADIQCRYGGDEFVVIMKNIDEKETVMKKAEDICSEFSDCSACGLISASCSCGIVMCGEDEKPSAELIEKADRALYRAKRENKGGCCLWDEE